MIDIDDDIPQGNDLDDVVLRARKRFKVAQDRESIFIERFRDDMRFVVGDSDNGYQWPDIMRNQRAAAQRPMLTVNKTHMHWLRIVNDMKQNAPSIKVEASGSGATYEAAQAYEAIIRHIERRSNAQRAYDKAAEFQVAGGIGYWRVVNEYVSDNGFEQELRIEPIPNPLDVLMDPHIKKMDGSDARYAFVYVGVPTEEFRQAYPDEAIVPVEMDSITDNEGWVTRDTVRVAEYYEVRSVRDWSYAIPQPDGTYAYMLWSVMTAEEREFVKKTDAGKVLRKRRVDRKEVHWYKIAGKSVVDHRLIPGKYIPVVRVPGEELIIDGQIERKGIVRYLKDPQRMYNYNTSAQIEYGALQSKAPWLAPLQAIDGLEDYWRTANTTPPAVLPFNAYDDQGREIPAPSRQDPPTAAPAYLQAMEAAANEMQMVSGHYDATMGAPSNETAGVAIQQRQRQGDLTSYHFIDAQAAAVAFTGRVLVGLIPHIYDTERVFRIIENGHITEVHATQQDVAASMETVQDRTRLVFKPGVGDYEVTADVGPNWATRRQEAWDSMTQIITQSPQLMQVMGDLAFRAADFPMADEIAERLKRTIPPALLGDGPSPQEQHLMQQLQLAQKQLQIAEQKVQELTLRTRDRSGELMLDAERLRMEQANEHAHRQIDVYEAETVRLRELARIAGTQREQQQIERSGISGQAQ